VGSATDQNRARPNRKTQQPIVKLALLRRCQVALVTVLPTLTVNVRNTTPGYSLQRVAELPTEVIDTSNINGSQVPSRPVVFFDLECLF
jgi:hypothetical protein